MSTKPANSDYLYTGGDEPDRTGAALVFESSIAALFEEITELAESLNIEGHPFAICDTDGPVLELALDDSLEEIVNPGDLPGRGRVEIHLIEPHDISEDDDQLGETAYRQRTGDDGEPLVLAEGEFDITVLDNDAGEDTLYGLDESPTTCDDGEHAARSYGPHHEVRISTIDLVTDEALVESLA